jgi:hypothetical protein
MDKLFVLHKPFVGHLKTIQQRMTYRFFLKDIDYTVELSKYQDRSLAARRSLVVPPEGPTVTYEPRWSLDVYQMDWDRKFTTNERLEVGERADWSDDVNEWFPEDFTKSSEDEDTGNGFAHLMEKLKALGRVIKDVEEDLIGGMTVG